MKRQHISLLLTLLMSMVGARVFAYDANIDGIYYNFSGTKATVTYMYKNNNQNAYEGKVVIPESVTYNEETYTVTTIGDYAFSGCTSLTSVMIPNSVTNIGWCAFKDCSGLTSVTIPNSVTSIGSYAFSGCSGLTSVTIPNSVTSIGGSAFYGCSGLTSVTIPNSVTSIGSYAFSGCTGLTSVTIPGSVTSIGDSAFRGCYRLTAVTIPNSVTSIGSGAFYECSGLTSVTIPNSVTSIGDFAFYRCIGLTSVHISDIAAWCNISFRHESNPLEYAHHLYLGEEEIKDLVIPNSVTSIRNYAFLWCSGLTSVTIPNSVTSIGDEAFYGCSGLTSVTIPGSVTSIGSWAFSGTGWYNNQPDGILYLDNWLIGYKSEKPTGELVITDGTIGLADRAFEYCSGLTAVTFPNSVTSIGYAAFAGCSGLTAVTIPNSVTSIGNWAFHNCSGLTSVTIPNNVTSIEQSTFNGCSGLTSVTIPNSVTSIGESAFQECSGLTSVTIGDNVISIGTNAFYGCSNIYNVKVTVTDFSYFCNNIVLSLIYTQIEKPVQLIDSEGAIIEEFVVPENVTSIGNGAFMNCRGLTSVTIPNSVTSIGDRAFAYCYGLTSVTFHCKEIGNWFSGLGSIKDVVIGEEVTKIGASAFSDCRGMNSITIPNNVTRIDKDAFAGCSRIDRVNISDLASWCNISLGNANANPINFAHCFYLNGEKVKDLVLPDSVTVIKFGLFYGCSYLKSVTIPNSVTSIIKSAFYGCSGLTSITIPNSVTSIGDYTFGKCNGLTSVTIGSGVTSIGSSAFSGCERVEEVIALPMIPPHIEQNTFSNVKNISLYVPPGKIAAYKAADIWKGFKVIDELQYIFKSVTQQGIKMQFRVVDDEEKTVETYAGDYNSAEDFVPCINSETKGDLIIPAEIDGYRVVGIGSNSFRECIGITSVSIPAGISYIGEGAFRLATNLRAVNIPEGVEEIMAYSFNGCPLTMVVLPSTLKRITGTYAFRYGNIKNESATCIFIANMKHPCILDENSIFGMEYYDLYVPKNRIEFYLDEPQWDKFRSIHEMGEVDEDATDRVMVSSVTLKAGENATLTVSLNTTGGTNYNGYQFNLYLPEGISVATDENGNYLVTEKTGRKKVALPLDDGSVLFYTTADKNHTALTTGTLMEIELTADSALEAGNYTVRIERVTCATRDNESVGLPSSTATVTVEKAGTDTQGVITADDVEGEPASRITLPVFLNNAKDINAFYFDLTLPKGVAVAMEKNGQFIASFTGDYADTMLLSSLPWDASMGTTNNVNTWRFIATPKDNGVFHANAGRVMNVMLDVDKDMAGGVYTVRMNVVKLVEANDAAGSRIFGMMHAPTSSAAWTSYSTITIKTQKQGDVNGDNTIDVADIATVISVMAGSADVSSASADVNGDGTVDVADIAAIIDTMAANARRRNIEN